MPSVLQRYQQATDRNGRHVSPSRSTLRRLPYRFATARSSPMSPKGSTSGSRRTMMRNTESVQGPIPLIPSRASAHECPSCTLERISFDLCRTAIQHWARRSDRPNARRLFRSGTGVGDAVARVGYADRTLSARRHAARVEICWAMTIRTSPQIGSSVGKEGHRADCDAIRPDRVASRADKTRSAGGSPSASISAFTLNPAPSALRPRAAGR